MSDKRDTGSGRPRIEKLDVKPGQRVALLGLEDEEFETELRERGADVVDPKLPGLFDHVFVYMESDEQTFAFGLLRPRIFPAGALWAIWPKGNWEFNENDIRRRVLEAGLVDVKVVSFSHRLSGLKCVVRKENR